jgi:F0F1-type ATP synthase membrane subunit b/b'
MAAERDERSEPRISDATSRLARLLETEDELERMLNTAKKEAKELVEAARIAAEARVRSFESELEGENEVLRERIVGERDRAIDSIRKDAREEVDRLTGLDDGTIAELARYVLDLLVGRSDSGGSR